MSISFIAMLYNRPTIFFKKHGAWGPFFIRITIGFHLIYGILDDIVDRDSMQKFIHYFSDLDISFPATAAYISVYIQFFGGLLFLLGYYQRTAAFVIAIHFIFAIFIAHIGDTYQHLFPALFVLAASVSLFFSGPGKLAIDHTQLKRRKYRFRHKS